MLLALLMAVAWTGYYVARTVERSRYWAQHRDEPIVGWMSVGYVAHSYDVPPPLLYRALRLPPHPPDKRPLNQIARRQNRPVRALVGELQVAISQYRSAQPTPASVGPE